MAKRYGPSHGRGEAVVARQSASVGCTLACNVSRERDTYSGSREPIPLGLKQAADARHPTKKADVAVGLRKNL
jgi:hypothetical protein